MKFGNNERVLFLGNRKIIIIFEDGSLNYICRHQNFTILFIHIFVHLFCFILYFLRKIIVENEFYLFQNFVLFCFFMQQPTKWVCHLTCYVVLWWKEEVELLVLILCVVGPRLGSIVCWKSSSCNGRKLQKPETSYEEENAS